MNQRFVALLLIVVFFGHLTRVYASGAFDNYGPTPISVYKDNVLNNQLPSPTDDISKQLVRISDSISELAHKKDYTLLSVVVAFLIGLAGIFKLDERLKKIENKPVINVTIKPEPPYSLKIPMKNFSTGASWDVYYYRFRVENTGNAPIENVDVFVNELFKKDGTGQYVKVQHFLPMNLVWEQNHVVTLSKIQPNLFKHCDFGHIRQYSPYTSPENLSQPIPSVFFILSTEVNPFNNSNVLVPGDYKIKMSFSASNIKLKTIWYELCFKDFWSDDEPTMLRTALSITEVGQI